MKCIIIKDCSEEHSMGSTPSEEVYVYTDKDLADKFITKWNEQQQKQMERFDFYEKNDEKDNCYFGSKTWCYWLEVEEGEININPNEIF